MPFRTQRLMCLCWAYMLHAVIIKSRISVHFLKTTECVYNLLAVCELYSVCEKQIWLLHIYDNDSHSFIHSFGKLSWWRRAVKNSFRCFVWYLRFIHFHPLTYNNAPSHRNIRRRFGTVMRWNVKTKQCRKMYSQQQ